MKKILFYLLPLLTAITVPAAEEGWQQVPEILARIQPPQIPAHDFVITGYGAVGDGVTDASAAISQAITAAAALGSLRSARAMADMPSSAARSASFPAKRRRRDRTATGGIRLNSSSPAASG